MSRLILIFLTFFVYVTPIFAADSLAQLVKDTAALKLNLFNAPLLEPEQAFEFSANVKSGNSLYVSWEIAPNYYLYREKIKLELVNSAGIKLGDYTIPNGLPKHDEAFGDVQILSEDLNFNVPLLREEQGAQTIKLRAYFQGCAEQGVCYPPMTKEVMLDLPVALQLKALPEIEGIPEKTANIPPLILILLIFSIIVLMLSIIIAARLKNHSNF